MTGQQKMILFLTFITGAFGGAYLYITTFAPQYTQDDVPEKNQITIVGEMYGGCARGGQCASFRLSGDRLYQYMKSEDEREEGKIPRDLLDAVLSQLSAYRLQSYAAPAAIRDCHSYVDGIDYKYEVSFEGKRYVLDTCTTLLPHDSKLQMSLLDVWDYVNAATTSYPVLLEKGVGGWLLNQFEEGREE